MARATKNATIHYRAVIDSLNAQNEAVMLLISVVLVFSGGLDQA